MCVIASYDIKIAIYYYFFFFRKKKKPCYPHRHPLLSTILNFVAPFCSIVCILLGEGVVKKSCQLCCHFFEHCTWKKVTLVILEMMLKHRLVKVMWWCCVFLNKNSLVVNTYPKVYSVVCEAPFMCSPLCIVQGELSWKRPKNLRSCQLHATSFPFCVWMINRTVIPAYHQLEERPSHYEWSNLTPVTRPPMFSHRTNVLLVVHHHSSRLAAAASTPYSIRGWFNPV